VGLALTSSLMSSCSSADKLSDLGEASQRTREVLREYTDRLEGNKGYWLLTYWPDSRLRYGGYNFFVHFEGGKVTGLTELHPTAVTSLYDVTTIDQPTLCFSTFNDALLHFSKSSEYFRSARGGDFELLLKEIKGDTILLEGRKQLPDGSWRGYMSGQSIPPLKVTAHVSYRPLKDLALRLFGLHTGSRDRFAPTTNPATGGSQYEEGEGPVKPITLLSLQGNYRLGAFTLGLGVENLLNTSYYPIQSQLVARDAEYTQGNGRMITLSLGYRF